MREPQGKLEVDLERPVVEIHCSDRDKVVVQKRDLLMQEAVCIPVDLHTALNERVLIGMACKPHRPVVTLLRQKDAYVHTPHGCGRERGLYVQGRHEIGRGDPETLFRSRGGFDECDCAFLQFVRRSRGHDQHRLVTRHRNIAHPGKFDTLTACPQPVFDEGQGTRNGRRTLDPDMRVPPMTEPAIAADILVGHVVTADERGLKVDHDKLAVIAVIEAHRAEKPQELVIFIETANLDAGIPQSIEKGSGQGMAADIVIKKLDFHAFPSTRDQRICHFAAELVVMNGEELKEDAAVCRRDRILDRGKCRIAVNQKLRCVSGQERHSGDSGQHGPVPGFLVIGEPQFIGAPCPFGAPQRSLDLRVVRKRSPAENEIERNREIGQEEKGGRKEWREEMVTGGKTGWREGGKIKSR